MPATKRSDGLGVYVTYTHPDDEIAASKLYKLVIEHKLDEFVELFPQLRSGAEVFMSACRSVESRRTNGQEVRIAVEQAANDASEVIYQITRQVRDRKNKLVEHPKGMTLAFDKNTEKIVVRPLEDFDKIEALEQEIRDHYKRNTKTVHGQKIRNAIRDVVIRMGGQNIRRKAGGLYFVPSEYSSDRGTQPTGPVLDHLADLLYDLYGDRGDFYTIECPDTDKMRSIVAKHFAINVGRESGEALEKALNRVRKGKGDKGVRADFLANVAGDYRRLSSALEQFDSLVGVERTEIESNLKDLGQALNDLQTLDDPTP